MDFPLISFFYNSLNYYKQLRLYFILNNYFKLHNILFTNLYIRLYRKRLLKIEDKNIRFFSNRLKRKNDKSLVVRYFMYNIYLFLRFESKNKVWNKRKKKYIYINKFKDCGNQYNFDPFYPMTTYLLSEFNLQRTNRLNFDVTKKKIVNLSFFDKRLGVVNFKFFNSYIFSLILSVYKKTNKKEFLYALRHNNLFFYNFLLFIKKRIQLFRYLLLELKKKLQCFFFIFNTFDLNMENDIFFNYIRYKNPLLISDYERIVKNVKLEREKYVHYYGLYSKYKNFYKLLLDFLKKPNSNRISSNFKVTKSSHRLHVNRYERLLEKIGGKYERLFRKFFILKNKSFYVDENKELIYISILKYLSIFKSLFRFDCLNKYNNSKAVIYIKSTITNVFLYFIYNNKLLFKRTCGELEDVKKKERRFWRNIYPLVETLLPFISKMKSLYKFPYVSLYINGTSSLCSPLITRMRKYNKKYRRLVRFLFNELEFFNEKTLELKERFKGAYILYPIYRIKFFAICDGFNRLSKVFFAINKVKDLTSWPYNGCFNKKRKRKKKKKKNVR